MTAAGALGRRVSASGTIAAATAAAAAATPRLQQRTVRRCHSSPAPSTSKATVPLASSTVSEWPSFLKPRLVELRTNIIDQLAGSDRIPEFLRMRQTAIDAGDGAAAAAPTMESMARLYFERGGKLFRPTIAMLMASACNQEAVARGCRMASSFGRSEALEVDADDISGKQAAIALIAEMIHVASLVHDDVIDEAPTRRGAPSVNGCWGNKMAVLAGDFILARATQALCQIGDPRVISTMARIIEDLVVGEFLQMAPELSPEGSRSTTMKGEGIRSPAPSALIFEDRLSLYVQKSERKTASLFENSCRSVAMLASDSEVGLHEVAAAYGRHVGLAFQLVDDAIDYEEQQGDSSAAGKPLAVDLEQGLITGPLLMAVSSEAELARLLRRPPDQIRETVRRSGACERTRDMATTHARTAAEIASSLRSSNGASEALASLALKQLERRV